MHRALVAVVQRHALGLQLAAQQFLVARRLEVEIGGHGQHRRWRAHCAGLGGCRALGRARPKARQPDCLHAIRSRRPLPRAAGPPWRSARHAACSAATACTVDDLFVRASIANERPVPQGRCPDAAGVRRRRLRPLRLQTPRARRCQAELLDRAGRRHGVAGADAALGAAGDLAAALRARAAKPSATPRKVRAVPVPTCQTSSLAAASHSAGGGCQRLSSPTARAGTSRCQALTRTQVVASRRRARRSPRRRGNGPRGRRSRVTQTLHLSRASTQAGLWGHPGVAHCLHQ